MKKGQPIYFWVTLVFFMIGTRQLYDKACVVAQEVAFLQGVDAVYDYVLNAWRVLVRLLVCAGLCNSLRVEDGNVGSVAWKKQTSVLQANS